MADFPMMGIPDTGDTAWMLTSSAFVLLMTPGLAFFYGGMVRAKGVLNMLMMSISAMGLVGVLWVLYGYSMAFGNDILGTDYGGLLGDPTQYWGMKGLFGGTYLQATPDAPPVSVALAGTIPQTVFVAFQAMFAIITVALISGALADRLRFGPWLVFAGLWATLVYFPVAHWVFCFSGITGEKGGWLAMNMHAIDFAGGTAVHINSGAAGLALCIVLGRRRGWHTTPMRPHNLPFTMLGAGLLWFGWFGFNAGSAVASNGVAGATFLTTFTATATAMFGWLLVERIRDGKPTSLGAASGIVAGLVAITPSCSSVNVIGAIIIGLVAGIICALAVGLKYKLGFDDSLDVVGVHMIGGLVGTLMVGLVATATAPAAVDGLFYGGDWKQLGIQAIGGFSVMFYSFTVAAIIALAIKYTLGLRVSVEEEDLGIDETEHAETAYDFASVGTGTSLSMASASAGKEAGE
ncbi:MAG: ammonium transporter, Amt family [Mycobacterium sp.]|nr:ammonium transporter, Amt family [Mycobacterium sp.]